MIICLENKTKVQNELYRKLIRDIHAHAYRFAKRIFFQPEMGCDGSSALILFVSSTLFLAYLTTFGGRLISLGWRKGGKK